MSRLNLAVLLIRQLSLTGPRQLQLSLLFLLSKPLTFALFALGQPQKQIQVLLLATCVYLASAFALLPRLGAVGSAIWALLVVTTFASQYRPETDLSRPGRRSPSGRTSASV